jgi:hypothetical protein
MPGTIQRTEPQFREVNATGVFVLKTKANHADSMALLEQNGLRPLKCSEALVLIDRHPELKEQLKGKWFHLDEAEKGPKKRARYTFDNEGTLSKVKRDRERTVNFWDGKNPLSLYVRVDNDARVSESRFFLDAYYGDALGAAPVVVGVRKATTEIEVRTPTEIEVSKLERK